MRGSKFSRGFRSVVVLVVGASAVLALVAAWSNAFSTGPPLRQQPAPRKSSGGLALAGAAPGAPAGSLPGQGAAFTTARGLALCALVGVAVRRASRPQLLTRGASAASSNEALSELDPQKAVVRRINDAAETFVTPAVWNRPVVRALVLVLGGACAGRVAPFAGMMHVSAYGIWLGTNIWTTFIAGITMFKSLPRQQFGSLQAKLFPKYFQLGTLCTAVMALSGVRLGLPAAPATASLIFTLMNLLYLEPKATSVMFERYERENQGLKDPAVDKKLKSEFSKLHGMSSLANLLALVALVTHGVYLSARL